MLLIIHRTEHLIADHQLRFNKDKNKISVRYQILDKRKHKIENKVMFI